MSVVVKQHCLDNGLQLIGELNSANKSAALGFFVKTGSRDEVSSESGVSHFLEHMMFKGTLSRSAIDVTYALGNIGAQANAYTSEECTVFYSAIMPEYFGGLHELLSDMLRPALDPEEFSTEKKVILEEIALYLDRPHFYLYEQGMLDYYQGHPAGNSILGTTESVSKIEPEDMRNYFDRRYSPRNMVCVAAGNFDWDSFVADAQKHCGNWKSFEVGRVVEPYCTPEMSKEYYKKNINQGHAMLLTDGASAQEEERYALTVLSMILGDATGSKLYWELVDKGMADCAGCDADDKDGTGCFMVYLSMEPDRIEQVVEIARRILADPLDFSEMELESAKTKLASKIVLSGELPMARLTALGNAWIYRKEIHSLREDVRKVKAVSRDDIKRVLEEYPLKTWGEFRLLPERS